MSVAVRSRPGPVARPPGTGPRQVRPGRVSPPTACGTASGTWALGYDRGHDARDAREHWSEGLPDLEAIFDLSELRPGWEEGTRVVVADLTRHGEPVGRRAAQRAAHGGRRLARTGLRRPRSAWSSRPTSSPPTALGGWRPIDTPGALVYGTGPAVDPARPDRRDLAGLRGGRDPPGVGQLRVRHAPVRVHACATTTRCAPPTTASSSKCWRARSRTASGSCSPSWASRSSDRGGSGLHINFSLVADAAGHNVVNDAAAPDGLVGARACTASAGCSRTTAPSRGCARRR